MASIIVLPLVLALLAGAIRVSTGSSFEPAFLAALLVVTIGAYFGRGHVRRVFSKHTGESLDARAWMAAVMLLSITVVVWRTGGGLSSLGSADAGYHLRYLHDFLGRDPLTYNGFFLWYALAAIPYRIIGVDPFNAFVVAHLYCVAVWSMFVVLFVRTSRSPGWYTVVGTIAAQLLVGLPILFYLQGDGFLPQLLGTVVYLAAILMWQHAHTMLRQVAVIVLAAIILRYSYGLNLADLLAGFSAAFFMRHRHNRLAAMIAVAPLGCAIFAYSRLAAIASLDGGVREFDPLLVAMLLIVCIVIVFSTPAARRSAGAELLSYTTASALLMLGLYSWFYGFPPYYGHKYTLSLLAVWSVVLPVTALQGGFLQRGALLCVVVGSVMTYRIAITSMWVGASNHSLIDRAERRLIATELHRRNAKFGGYVSPWWPTVKFLNEALGKSVSYADYLAGLLNVQPGYCVFWSADQPRRDRLRRRMKSEGGQAGILVDSLSANAKSQVFDLTPPGTQPYLQIGVLCNSGAPS